MKIVWTNIAWDDYIYWQTTNKQVLKKINHLIKEIQRNLYAGIGKPEPLRFELAGKWSRRIDAEHRLIYTVAQNEIIIFQCRYHY